MLSAKGYRDLISRMEESDDKYSAEPTRPHHSSDVPNARTSLSVGCQAISKATTGRCGCPHASAIDSLLSNGVDYECSSSSTVSSRS